MMTWLVFVLGFGLFSFRFDIHSSRDPGVPKDFSMDSNE
jgi:hypothetical protein